MMQINSRRRLGRSGFTVIELMIVIAIIAVLVALTTVAVVRFSGLGPRNSTITTLDTIKGGLMKQWGEVREKAQRESIPNTNNTLHTSLLSLVNQTANPIASSIADPRVRAKWVELRLRQAFPTSFAEVYQAASVLPGGGNPYIRASSDDNFAWKYLGYSPYRSYLASLGVQPPDATGYLPVASHGNTPPEEQMAICLQMVLERGPCNPGLTPDKLGRSASLLRSVNTTSAYGCVDGWGRALWFARNTPQDPTNPSSPLVPLQPVVLSVGLDGKAGLFVDITYDLPPSPSGPGGQCRPPITLTLLPTNNPDRQYAFDNLVTRPEWETILRP